MKMLRRPIFTRPLTRQLLGNSRYFCPVRITSSPRVFSRASLRRSSNFNLNSSTSRSYSATELDVVDFRIKNDGPSTLANPHYSYAFHYWGFVIIRTTYTPESDLQWPVAMAKLSDSLRLEMKENYNASIADQERLIEKFRNLIADDKALYDGMPMNDAILHFDDIINERYNVTLKYSSPEHFEKGRNFRIPELVEQSLAESDPEVKKDLLEASYWNLNSSICLVMDEESLNDLVELPVELPRFDLTRMLYQFMDDPHSPPPFPRTAFLKVALQHSDFDLTGRKLCYSAEDPDWYAQWAKWAVHSGLGQMHRSYEECSFDAGVNLELLYGQPYLEIYPQD